jgi:hypothetical protein
MHPDLRELLADRETSRRFPQAEIRKNRENANYFGADPVTIPLTDGSSLFSMFLGVSGL